MKKLRTILGAVSVLSIAAGGITPASAGEGGIAGAATFFLQDGSVVQSSVAGAIGKSNATASSAGGLGVTAATAFGSAGELKTQFGVGIGASGGGLSYDAQGKQDTAPTKEQDNTLRGELKQTPTQGRLNF